MTREEESKEEMNDKEEEEGRKGERKRDWIRRKWKWIEGRGSG